MWLQTKGLVTKFLELSVLVLPKGMVVKKFPSVVTDDLELVVIVEVLMVVIRETLEEVRKGVEAEKDNEIVGEEGALMLAVKGKVVEVEVEVLDMDPKVL